MRLQNKHIVVGITGGIAAYKSASLVRLLVKEGAEVQVVMTPAAKEFITPLTLATLSQHAVVSDFFDRRDGSWHSHVTLGTCAGADRTSDGSRYVVSPDDCPQSEDTGAGRCGASVAR